MVHTPVTQGETVTGDSSTTKVTKWLCAVNSQPYFLWTACFKDVEQVCERSVGCLRSNLVPQDGDKTAIIKAVYFYLFKPTDSSLITLNRKIYCTDFSFKGTFKTFILSNSPASAVSRWLTILKQKHYRIYERIVFSPQKPLKLSRRS